MNYWLHLFIQQIKETSWLVWIAVILSVAEVLLAKINNIWLYPTGIGGTVIGIYILVIAGLYAESVLNVYYVVMSIYGWIYWVKKTNEPPVKISWSNKNEWGITLAIVFGGWLISYELLRTYTRSDVPVWDALASSTGWAGMWLLSRRKIENWILLNISNIFAIPLLFYKQQAMFGVLTVFLFVIGTLGYFEWRKIYNKEHLKPDLS